MWVERRETTLTQNNWEVIGLLIDYITEVSQKSIYFLELPKMGYYNTFRDSHEIIIIHRL